MLQIIQEKRGAYERKRRKSYLSARNAPIRLRKLDSEQKVKVVDGMEFTVKAVTKVSWFAKLRAWLKSLWSRGSYPQIPSLDKNIVVQ